MPENNNLNNPIINPNNRNTSSDLSAMMETLQAITTNNKELKSVLTELKTYLTKDKDSGITATQMDKLFAKYLKNTADRGSSFSGGGSRSSRTRFNYLEEEDKLSRINFKKIKDEIEEREYNIKAIQNFTNAYDSMNKSINSLTSEIDREVRKLKTNKISYEAENIKNELNNLTDRIQASQKNLFKVFGTDDSSVQKELIQKFTDISSLKATIQDLQDAQKQNDVNQSNQLLSLSGISRDEFSAYVSNISNESALNLLADYIKLSGEDEFTGDLSSAADISKYFKQLDTKGVQDELNNLQRYIENIQDNQGITNELRASAVQLNSGISDILNNLDIQQERLAEDFTKRSNINKAEIKRIQGEIDTLEDSAQTLYTLSEQVAVHYDKLAEYDEDTQQLLENMLKAQSDILSNNKELRDSLKDIIDPTGYTKATEETIKKISAFINPKQSEEFLNALSRVDEQIQSVTDSLADLTAQQDKLSKDEETITQLINSTQQLIDERLAKISELESQGDFQQADEEKTKLTLLQLQLKEHKAEAEINKHQQTIIDEQLEFLDEQHDLLKEQRQELENNTSFTKNVVSKVLTKVQTFALDGIDRFTSNLQSAADRMFSAIEETQKSIGKTLKMTSGDYSQYVDMMQALAKEQGVAVTSDELLKLSEAVVNTGITNTELLGQLTVGQAKLNESGTFFNVDEEFLKTLQRQYESDIRANMSQEEINADIQNWYNTLIATQQGLAEKFGSATALASGGSNEILNILNQSVRSGIMTNEAAQENYREIAGLMQSIDMWGGESSQLLSIMTTLKDNPVGDLSTDLKAFINTIGFTQNQLVDAINSGNMVDVMQQYMDYVSRTYTATNRTDLLYQGKAYSAEMTADQIAAYKSFSDDIIESYQKNTITEQDIADISKDIQDSISKGDYLTESEKYENKQLEATEDMAQTFQKVADGQFWMDKGLGEINTMINDGAKFVTDLLIAKLMSSGALGGLFAKGLGKGGAGGTVGEALSTESASVPLAGTTSMPKMNQLGVAVGGIQAATVGLTDIISGIQAGESTADVLYNTLTDSKFTAGLGGAIGSAVGGPIGMAIGEGVGALIPVADDLLSSFLVNVFEGDFQKEELEREREKAEYIKEASAELSKASQKLADDSEKQLANLPIIQKAVEDFSNADKDRWLHENETWLKENDLLNAQELTNLSESEVNTLFEDAVNEWKRQQDEIARKRTESEILQSATGSIAQVLGVDNMLNYTLDDLIENQGIRDAQGNVITESLTDKMINTLLENYDFARESGIDLEALASGDIESQKLLDTYNALMEHKMNVKLVSASGGIEQLEQLKSLITEGQTLEDVINEVYSGAGYTQENIDELVKIFSDIESKGTTYDRAKELNNSHATGLDYVPYDDYPALLHEGEMILTREEAENYRNGDIMKMLMNTATTGASKLISDMNTTTGGTYTNTVLDVTPITNSVNSQTDRIEKLLIKILQVLSVTTDKTYPSRLPKSLVQWNSDLSTL